MSGPEFLVYQREGGTPGLLVRLEGDTVWLSQAQLVELFSDEQAKTLAYLSRTFSNDADRKASEEFDRWRLAEASGESAVEADFKRALEAAKKARPAKPMEKVE